MQYVNSYVSPLGEIILASDGESLIGLWFKGQKYALSTVTEETVEEAELPIFEETKKWLNIYFSGQEPDFFPEIKINGSPFRIEVLEILKTIPYGTTMTYKEVGARAAAALGKKSMSAQAVGGAVGHNPISIIIPCHRVVGTNGSLTGYAGGIEKKVQLLKGEGLDLEKGGFYEP